MACTDLVAVPPATKNGEIFLVWNFDITRIARGLFDKFRFYVSGGKEYSYAVWGIPGIVHIGMMNEEGLSFVGNAVGVSDGGFGGRNILEIIEKCLSTCSTVEEVAQVYKNTERLVIPGHTAAIFSNFNSMWADKNGDALTIEYSKNHMAVQEIGEEGVMVETNHHQYLDRRLSGSTNPEKQEQIAGSYCRLGRAWEKAKDYAGEFDLDKVKEFTADHGLNYDMLSKHEFNTPKSGVVDDSTVCCHLWNVPNYINNLNLVKAAEAVVEGETLFSFIIEPKEKTIHFCQGKPCKSSYVPLNFKKAFEKSENKEPIEQKLLQGKTKAILSRIFYALDIILPEK